MTVLCKYTFRSFQGTVHWEMLTKVDSSPDELVAQAQNAFGIQPHALSFCL